MSSKVVGRKREREIRGRLEPIEDGAPGNWNETERGSMALSMSATCDVFRLYPHQPSDFFRSCGNEKKNVRIILSLVGTFNRPRSRQIYNPAR